MKSKHGMLTLFAWAIILAWTIPSAAAPEKVTTKVGDKIQTPQPAGGTKEVAPKAAAKSGAKIETSQPAGGPKELSPIASYIFISEKNPFHPDRKEFPVQPPPPGGAPEVKKPIVRPQVVLYGVTIADDYESASLSNPGRPMRKGERETQTLRKGESIGEFKLTKILPDRIVLEAPEDSFEVLLYDPKAAKKRSAVKTENKPAAVTSLTSTPAPVPTAPPAPLRPVPPRAGAEAPKEPAKAPETPVAKPVAPAPVPTPSTGVRSRPAPRLPQRTIFRETEVQEEP